MIIPLITELFRDISIYIIIYACIFSFFNYDDLFRRKSLTKDEYNSYIIRKGIKKINEVKTRVSFKCINFLFDKFPELKDQIFPLELVIHCDNIGENLDIKYQPITEQILISEYSWKKRKRCKININWANFPNLKTVVIETGNIDINELIVCEKLEIICLDIGNDQETIPDWICKKQNLKMIIFSGNVTNPIHFESPVLERCIFRRMVEITTESTLVPDKDKEITLPFNFINCNCECDILGILN
jgi:hypothetical protein